MGRSSNVDGRGAAILDLLVVMAKSGRFATDRSGAPLHRRSYGQVFVGDHRLQRGAGTLLGGEEYPCRPAPVNRR
jgi:hypothetical protein